MPSFATRSRVSRPGPVDPDLERTPPQPRSHERRFRSRPPSGRLRASGRRALAPAGGDERGELGDVCVLEARAIVRGKPHRIRAVDHLERPSPGPRTKTEPSLPTTSQRMSWPNGEVRDTCVTAMPPRAKRIVTSAVVEVAEACELRIDERLPRDRHLDRLVARRASTRRRSRATPCRAESHPCRVESSPLAATPCRGSSSG